MAGIRWPLVARRTHKWLALLLGLQVAVWTLTGFYMVVIHIDTIHGDNLVRSPPEAVFDLSRIVPAARVLETYPDAQELQLQRLQDTPVWRVQREADALLVNARSGRPIAPLSASRIRAIARDIYTGDDRIAAQRLLTKSPLEMQGREPPYWQVEFEGWNRPTLYLSPTTGELLSRRHLLWRVFDFAWMLHIMDYDERSNINNSLLRVATWSAVTMVLTGAWLLIWSFPRRKRKKKTV